MFTKEIQFYSPSPDTGTPVLSSVNVGRYPDGTPNVKGVVGGGTIVLRPKSLESFVTGLFLVDAMRERGMKVNNLLLPFIPGARQDRINSAGDALFTLKSVAKMINDRNFDQVVVFDPHSNVAPGLIDRCRVYPFNKMLDAHWVGYDGIIAPDAGAGHRANEFADVLNANHDYIKPLEVIQAFKKRDVETGKLSGFEVNVEAGKKYLVVDDICDGGGTFVGLGQKIKEQGAKAGLFVTHGIFSKGTNKLDDYYNVITTTDSTLFDKHSARERLVVTEAVSWMQ